MRRGRGKERMYTGASVFGMAGMVFLRCTENAGCNRAPVKNGKNRQKTAKGSKAILRQKSHLAKHYSVFKTQIAGNENF